MDGPGLGSAPEPGYKPKHKKNKRKPLTNIQKRRAYLAGRARRAAELAEIKSRACARVLSMGGGVQSTACLLRYADEYDYVVFADPGAEWPHTYEHLEKHIKPFCAEHGIEYVRITSKKGRLEDHCLEKKVIPTRLRRWCTSDWKVEPMHEWYRKTLGATAERPVVVDLGISFDEYYRASRPERVSYEYRNYPLADAEITREQCQTIIQEHGWPRPGKSSCDFCPYVKDREFRKLLAERPDRFKEIVALEMNGSDYPNTLLRHNPIPLAKMAENAALGIIDDNDNDDNDDHCTSGHCFT